MLHLKMSADRREADATRLHAKLEPADYGRSSRQYTPHSMAIRRALRKFFGTVARVGEYFGSIAGGSFNAAPVRRRFDRN